MRDPHVVALHYRLETAERFRFADDAAPVEGKREGFQYRLEAGHLRVELLEPHDHATVESARAVVDRFVRAWELDVALRGGRREMRFIFQRPEVIDWNPPGPGETVNLAGEVAGMGFAAASPTVVMPAYPEPPSGFEASSDVEAMMHLYELAIDGRTRLVDAAYYVLTTVEDRSGVRKGRRPKAACLLGIDEPVLKKLGCLSSNVGDERTVRKRGGAPLRPHTPREQEWMQAAMRLLIRRVAEYDADPSVASRRLTMGDLPPLASG